MAVTTQVRILVWTFYVQLELLRLSPHGKKLQGGFEPPSLDSKSRVLTVTPLEPRTEIPSKYRRNIKPCAFGSNQFTVVEAISGH